MTDVFTPWSVSPPPAAAAATLCDNRVKTCDSSRVHLNSETRSNVCLRVDGWLMAAGERERGSCCYSNHLINIDEYKLTGSYLRNAAQLNSTTHYTTSSKSEKNAGRRDASGKNVREQKLVSTTV